MNLPLLHSLRRWLLLCTIATTASAQPSSPVTAPRFTHPGAGQVFYFVLTDRFANGAATNDTGGISGGADISGFDPTRISHYHGGDFAGLTARLDYIKHLGATAVWVTPPFKNKAMQSGSAGYHGYWILDFLHLDPHLGTDAEFHEFVTQAHARGLKVYMDIIVNHTADVIAYRGGQTEYVTKATAPYRDATGKLFDEHLVAFNGVNSANVFPALSSEKSFAYIPVVPPNEAHAKNPVWLNDPIYYHNRGNSLFKGESSVDGDFSGLDDLFTENPVVVQGFIDIYEAWIKNFGIDGFRIDTTRHVNLEFWQAFAPAIREYALHSGHPDFIQFGEVANDEQDVALLSEFSTTAPLDTTLDFGFFRAALAYVSQEKSATALADLFAKDDYYTDHDSNVQATTTFLGNHDAGRFGYFLQHDNPRATPDQLAQLVQFGHGLLFLVRGQPVIYYGDEQGMIGQGGNDMQAREDMFPAQAPDFRNAMLLDTTRTGADDKFDERHPLYRTIHDLAALRTAHPALSRGAMIPRPTGESGLFAFSRIERNELVEYLAVFNNSRTATRTTVVPTSQPTGAALKLIYNSPTVAEATPSPALIADVNHQVSVTLAPLQFALWRAEAALSSPAEKAEIKLVVQANKAVLSIPTREMDGHIFPAPPEIRANVTGGDGMAEVTFCLQRRSRPGQYELLGIDDAPPYRIFWRPPADLAPNDEISFVATVDNLRGGRATSTINGLTVATGTPTFGIKGSVVPLLKVQPPAIVTAPTNEPFTLVAHAEGSGPLHYQWLRDGIEIPHGTEPVLTIPHPGPAQCGNYRVMVRGLAGTIISSGTVVTINSTNPAAN